jgi:hypothetical protein
VERSSGTITARCPSTFLTVESKIGSQGHSAKRGKLFLRQACGKMLRKGEFRPNANPAKALCGKNTVFRAALL